MAKIKETNPVEQELTGVVSFSDTVGSMPNPDVILRKSGISTDVYEEMLYDPQIFSAYQKRKRKIQQLKYKVEGEDQNITEFVSEVLTDINMSRLIAGMVRALPFGYSVSEIIWESVDGKWIPTDIKNRSNKRFEFSEKAELLYDTGVEGMKEAPYGKFIVHRNDFDDDGNPYGTSLNSRCYWYWRFKKHGWRVWGLYLEKYGDPALVLKSLETDEEKITKLLAQLNSVSQGSNIVIGQSESLDPLNTPSSGSIGYNDYVSESDKQISKVYLGSSMLMDESKTGTYATAKEHGDDLMDIVMSDADAIANTIRYDLIEPLVIFNFGIDSDIPVIQFYNDDENDETQGIVEDKTNGETKKEGAGEETTEASLQNGVSDSFFSTSQVEQFATDLPKHKQVIENLSHALGKSQVKLFRKHLKFKGMSNRPQYARLELSKWYDDINEDLSTKIAYALFYIKMFAKIATPSYRAQFSGDIADDYFSTGITGSTILPFDEARKLFEDKVPVSDDEFREMVAKAKQDSFSIAGIKSRSILKQIQESLAKAMEDGTGEYQWKKIGERLMQSLGVQPINRAHLANIYRTNLFSAYSRAGYEQYKLIEKEFPALMYDAVGDNRTRPAHLALDNKVFMADDPFWETHYPPNGYNCRCSVIPISKKKLKNVKVENGEDYMGSKYAPDDGWDFHGGKGDRLTNPPTDFGKPKTMNAPYSEYNLPRDLPFADFTERPDIPVDFENEFPYYSGIDIGSILGEKIHIGEGDWSIHPDVFGYITQHPAEVWQQLGDKDAGKLYALGIKVESYRNKPIPIGIKVDKYGNVTDIVKITNADRKGTLLYPTFVPKERPFADLKYEYADSIDRWSSSFDATHNIRQSFYNSEYPIEGVDKTAKEELDKMFTNTYGDNAGRVIYRGIKAKKHPKEYYTDAIEQSGGLQDNAPSSWTTSKRVAEDFAGEDGIVFVAYGVDVEGYDISDVSKLGNEREVILAPATDLKLNKMNTDEYSNITYIELEVSK